MDLGLNRPPGRRPDASQAIRDSHLLAEQLQEALNSRVAIEEAKGVISERLGCDMDEAFNRLRRLARSSQRRLVEVAEGGVEGAIRTEEL